MKNVNVQKINTLKTYIKDVINVDLDIRLVPDERLGRLPYAIMGMYSFYAAKFFNQELILMFVNPDETSVDRVHKHVVIVENTLNVVVIAVFEALESFTRRRLIEKKVPFIIPGKQMYLPDLMIDLKEYVPLRQEQREFMPPAAQCLFLFYLQAHPLVNRNMKGIAEMLQYNPMKVTRAADYLQSVELCEIKGTKDKYLSFDQDKKALWKMALPLMTSPVKKINYYTGHIENDQLRRTGINALSHYTDLNDEQIAYYAAPAGYIKQFEGPGFINTGRMIGEICVEEWKYDPVILAKNSKFIDPLSLYLCFKNDKDERVQGALEDLIEKIKW